MNQDHSNPTWNELVKSESSELPLEPLPWSKLGRVQVIKNWVSEVIDLTQTKASLNDWNLVGHAIVLIHNDVDDCRKILQRAAADIGFDFTYFDEHFIQENFSGESISAQCDKATLVYLEPGNWMKNVEEIESQDSETLRTLQDNISHMVRQFSPELPIIFCTSIEKYEDLSTKFRKQGLFDRRFLVIKPSLEETAINFLEGLGPDICGDSLKGDLGKLGKLIDLEFDDKRRLGLVTIRLQRLARREKRKVEFLDLVEIAMRGSVESDVYPEKTPEVLRYVAVHEAGHATVAILDSRGENVPEYATIIEGEDFNGLVADSFAYHYSKADKKTYADFRHQIRVTLGGRVAEHLVYGAENVRLGSAKADLTKATDLCSQVFGNRGISINMETTQGASENLAIDAELTDANLTRIENMTRDFLARQYAIVFELLSRNKEFFEAIVENLSKQRLLNQKDLKTIYEACNVGYSLKTEEHIK